MVEHNYFNLTVFVLEVKIHMFSIMEKKVAYLSLEPYIGKTTFQILPDKMVKLADTIDLGAIDIHRLSWIYWSFQYVYIFLALLSESSFIRTMSEGASSSRTSIFFSIFTTSLRITLFTLALILSLKQKTCSQINIIDKNINKIIDTY